MKIFALASIGHLTVLRAIGVLALTLVIGTASATAGPIMYLTTSDGTALAALDTATGAATVIGSTGTSATYAAAFGSNGSLYTLVNSFVNAQLATIDLTTGLATVFGAPVGISNFMMLETSATGTMYGGSWTTDALYTVNQTTGAVTLVGSMGIDCAMDFAFSPTDVLYAVDSCSNALYTLNTTTGAATLVAGITGAANLMSLSFDSVGNLYGTAYNSSGTFYEINPTTGVATLINSSGLFLPHGGDIAQQEVPEPFSILLFGTGACGVFVKRGRKKQQAQ